MGPHLEQIKQIDPVAVLPIHDLGPWVSVVVPASLVHRVLDQQYIAHELSHIKIDGLMMIDARHGWIKGKSGTEISVFRGAPVISNGLGENIVANADYPCLALMADIETPQLQPTGRVGFSSSSPRFEVGVNWVEVELMSEPFVQPTSRGYAPAILVRISSTGEVMHILAGAKSLALGIERVRKFNSTLVGSSVRLRKSGPLKTDLYELELG